MGELKEGRKKTLQPAVGCIISLALKSTYSALQFTRIQLLWSHLLFLNKSKTRFFLREASDLCLNNKKSTAGQGVVSALFLFTTPYKKQFQLF